MMAVKSEPLRIPNVTLLVGEGLTQYLKPNILVNGHLQTQHTKVQVANNQYSYGASQSRDFLDPT